ncbi:unnamed protein product [Phytophthora lilii]|uniref:Unnamed protein product n=1 Tax=Phytophthora lilii TaxID=2077276 RepID=A0A9W7D976_9STRA|nr:unnamed protein product [Phytophthora lilii]
MQPISSAGSNIGVSQSGSTSGAAPRESDDPSTVATGRSEWRREEHGRFMQALEIYGSRGTGDEWKHITAYVGSRTIEEVRLHGRQYLQRLVQQLPPSPEAAAASRYLSSAGNQNDPNRQNYQVPTAVEHQKPRGKRVGAGPPIGGSSALSAAALECAQSMNVQAPVQSRTQPLQPLQQQPLQQQPLQQHTATTASHRNGRRSKGWTFQEDKAFETVLAGWAGSKPYPWAKIAAALPGKSVKDVRNRYEAMVGEVASIEAGAISVPERSIQNSVTMGPVAARPHGSPSSLSQRAVPPPPIEVPPRNVGKGELLETTRCLCVLASHRPCVFACD